MKNKISFLFLFFIYSHTAYSQANCSNPLQVSVCPSVTLLNQTNAGMGDDAPAAFNIVGEDIVYQITVPVTTTKIFISIINPTSALTARFMKDSCTNLNGISSIFSTGTNMYSFPASLTTTYFLWIDCYTSVNFGISFGADTSIQFVNNPNTQGNLQFDNSICATPVFISSKPFFQVKYNNIFQTNPMTLAPLNVPGNICLKTFFMNTTGDEGIRIVSFTFGSGYTNIIAPDSIPGNYNSGYWIRNGSGSSYFYKFYDAASSGRGDFDGSPNACLAYEFCFDLTPLSNNPSITNIDVLFTTDGFGAPFTGYITYGCCPSTTPQCHYSNGGSAAGVGTFGFGMNDPGGSLPIELVNFSLTPIDDKVEITWATASEINNDFFTIEHSRDSYQWEVLKIVKGAGNSTSYLNYTVTDNHPTDGISYYRLKQTDFDGTSCYFPMQVVLLNLVPKFIVSPNPASDKFVIQSVKEENYAAELYSIFGQKYLLPINKTGRQMEFNTSMMENGIYLLLIKEEMEIVKKETIVISH